jgi:UDP-N-acetylglucosamine--N-acetylmuramyl-(pentapeptide) pyrophosphoryl-undecaprenol N-acetylglucosamine transferase
MKEVSHAPQEFLEQPCGLSSGPILLVAGGSGGHMMPALAMAEALQERGYHVVLWTDVRGSAFIPKDFGKNPSENQDPLSLCSGTQTYISPGTFHHKVFHEPVVSSKTSLGQALRRSQNFLKAFRLYGQELTHLCPQFVWGFGGSFSVLPVLASALAGIPRGIHQSDCHPGKANSFLSPFVGVIALGNVEAAERFFFSKNRLVLTGTPVRRVFEEMGCHEKSYKESDPLAITILGGSQGASILSRVVPEAVDLLEQADQQRLTIIQQCRPEDLEGVRKIYGKTQAKVSLASFFPDLAKILEQTHMVIGRAGASTIAELAITKTPALLIPYPFASYHQYANAQRVEDAGGGWLQEEKEFTPLWLRDFLKECLDHREKLQGASVLMAGLNAVKVGHRMMAVMESFLKAQTVVKNEGRDILESDQPRK